VTFTEYLFLKKYMIKTASFSGESKMIVSSIK